MQAGYLSSLYFKDIYLYLAQNRLPSKKVEVETLAEKYILLNSLLFIMNPYRDIEEIHPHQEGFITKTYVAADQSYLDQPPELIELVNTLKVV